MNKTKIPYLDFTWNPIAMKCTHSGSPGCDNCWHIAMTKRMAENPRIDREIRARYKGDMPPVLLEYRLNEPYHRNKPAIIGVQLMGDLFHKDVSRVDISRVFNLMGNLAPQHTFLVLTKRVERAREILRRFDEVWDNIAVGTSVEDQERADSRIPILLQIPARWHWVSYEPALSELDFAMAVSPPTMKGFPGIYDTLSGTWWPALGNVDDEYDGKLEELPNIDAVVAGCESGPRRRPANPDWFRSVRDQCQQSGVSFFLKQMDVGGKVTEMPELDGQVWDQLPWRTNENQ